MKKHVAIVAIFLVLYGVFVIALMPANWLVGQIKLPSNVAVAGVEGSIWQTNISQVKVDDIVINNVESSLSLRDIVRRYTDVGIFYGKFSQ